jgi:DNA (cytosine-5)-methyltransferase 1
MTETFLFSEKETSAKEKRSFQLLDVFCGLGGVSNGFALEGFDVLGIDIEDMPTKGYKHKFLRADIRDLKGEDYRGYDVIWGSPPCRDFSQIGLLYGKKWKNPPNPQKGIETINAFLRFVSAAQPTFWIMENVANLKKYYKERPRGEGFITYGKRHVFYGNYPLFLMPRDMRVRIRCKNKNGRDQPNMKYLEPVPHHNRAIQSRQHAKIPLPCSRAFARACREALEEKLLEASLHA